ncbi:MULTISPECIES: hypothetical protein [Streptomyces]|uniref:Uncharacterized protein n=1 Tax=Streptomyces dengpaensis TaxID=2049881 RepID=A0ABN5HXH4_9ACTN|nr:MULTISPECIES: hypothetical protein [Streptomyces]AVH55649.1 hypothetical protein C4B68_07480 [Streptomyces dengpaensis]PIB11910.1 hypothetical protein B1C81_01440 [Streptomyces sp. HG99]
MRDDTASRGGVDRPTGGGPAGDDPSDAAFAAALSGFAAGLSPTDHSILLAALDAATGPWERMAARPAEELLAPHDARLVEQLAERAHSKER